MNTAANYSSLGGSRLLNAYLGDIRFEFVKMMRTPAFIVPTLFFPAMFYVLFGVIMGGGNQDAALHTFARMGVFGTMAPGLFGFGVSLAFEREYGLMTFKQALPTPPGSYLIARMVVAMAMAAMISILLSLLADEVVVPVLDDVAKHFDGNLEPSIHPLFHGARVTELASLLDERVKVVRVVPVGLAEDHHTPALVVR